MDSSDVRFVALSVEAYKAYEKLKLFFDNMGTIATVGTKEIANLYSMKENTLRVGHKYLLPAFGMKDGNFRWKLKEFYDWQSIPVEQRKAEYERLHALGEV